MLTITKDSDSYANDLKIINFCNENKNDSRCKCVIPEAGIKHMQLNLFNPYPCWYNPCASDETFKTSLIRDEQKRCNIVLCNVELGEVTIDEKGVLQIKNNCISSKNYNTNIISQELLDPSLRDDYTIPNYFVNTLFPVLAILGLTMFLKK